jgi:hypothetical protein
VHTEYERSYAHLEHATNDEEPMANDNERENVSSIYSHLFFNVHVSMMVGFIIKYIRQYSGTRKAETL